VSASAHGDTALVAPWRIGIDVGGTFTDMVLADASGKIHTFKVPSVPADPSEGVARVLQTAADACQLSLKSLLGDCNLFVHGSTVATNTMLEGKGATVGLITTRGFRDSLEIRRGFRENQWDHRRPFPPVLVPRYLRLPVGGRIDRNGDEIEPFASKDLETAIREFQVEGVESVAVALINSFLNPAHEKACMEMLRDIWDGAPDLISLSSEIMPIMGEYERTSTTVINAYLAPRVVPYLKELNARLAASGLARPFLLVQSNGGMTSVERIATRPVNLLLSGPAAGVGALHAYRAASMTDNLISMEIGGTSCDVMLMSEGKVPVHDELMVAEYHASSPAVNIHTIGAGGGTIAGVDDGGMLFVGPKGAGAFPGPACYGLGGSEPTVTDAQLILGRLREGPYADGSISLNLKLAEIAVEQGVADPLGLSIEDAAAGILRVVEQHLLLAVQRISIERGHDPRNFTLVPAGGAGPMHGAPVGRALGCRRVYIPRHSGVFCALGMLYTDVRHDITRVFLSTLDEAEPKDIEAGFSQLEADAHEMLAEEGFTGIAVRLARELDLSYSGQQWVVRVALDANGGQGPADIRKRFEQEYERLYGHIQPEGTIEISNQRVVGTGLLPEISTGTSEHSTTEPVPLGMRSVYVSPEIGWQDIPVFAGDALQPGHILDGPLLVEERTTTVLVESGNRLQVDDSDNLILELQVNEA
jgi:N-methylhydantoinase A